MSFDIPKTLYFTVFWTCQKSWLLIIRNSVPLGEEAKRHDQDYLQNRYQWQNLDMDREDRFKVPRTYPQPDTNHQPHTYHQVHACTQPTASFPVHGRLPPRYLEPEVEGDTFLQFTGSQEGRRKPNARRASKRKFGSRSKRKFGGSGRKWLAPAFCSWLLRAAEPVAGCRRFAES